MILLENLRKSFPTRGGRHVIFDHVNAVFPTGESVGLLGRNGAGKSTLLDLIAGVEEIDRGRILTDGNISYPVGFSGGFHGMMTGIQAARFVARVYGADTDEIIRFVEDFSELGSQLRQPLHTFSSGQKSRLSLAVSMAIPFDIYLVDEIGAVGDENFKMKSRALIYDRMENADIVMVDHGMKKIRFFCSMGAVIHEERLHIFDDIEEAISFYGHINQLTKGSEKRKNIQAAKAPWVTRVVEGLRGRARVEDE
ncbi:ABC transporter ATP-binding protein [Cognatiyoonia sp.]|uniref:ABC transporter ATP-binding protein n=1 Tax=Cognatiyoonia sp. TaxID=2211652 RepID=UPI003F69F596